MPRPAPVAATGIDWPVMRSYPAAVPVPPPPATFQSTVEARRSERRQGPIALRELANLLAVAQRPSLSWSSRGAERSLRPAAASGALHVIDVVALPRGSVHRAFRFDARRGGLDRIAVADHGQAAAIKARVAAMLPEAKGAILVLVADLGRLEAQYERCATLAWRDAGALMQTLHLYATAFRLSFCPLGVSGREVVDATLDGGVPAMAVRTCGNLLES